LHDMAGTAQIDLDQQLDRRLVFNYQNGCGHGLTVQRDKSQSIAA
jgi:hypothetical protein